MLLLFLTPVAQALAESAQVESTLSSEFHFFEFMYLLNIFEFLLVLTCQFRAQASCSVDPPATSAEPQHFPPFAAPSSPEEASSAVGSLGSLLCNVHLNF